MRSLRLIVCVLALVAAGGAWAQTKPALNEAAQGVIGAWELSNAARDKICTVTFSATAVKVGYKLAFAPECAGLFPLVLNVVGWRYPDDDLLYLLDAQGKSLVEFSEVEDGIFEAPTPGVGVLILHNPATAEPDNTEPPPGAESPQGGDNPPGGQPAAPQQAPVPQELPTPKGDGG